MSIRYIPNAPLPDMKKATISLWFKHSSQNAKAEPWDWGKYPPPPDKSQGLDFGEGGPDNGAFVFYDPYGDIPFQLIPYRGVPPLIYPFPPIDTPEVTDSIGRITPPGGLPHDSYNFMLTFGNPNQAYKYRKWVTKKISSTPGVLEMHVPFVYADWPPPYRPYYKVYPSGPNQGQPLGDDGKLDVYTITLADTAVDVPNMVTPSFIGVNKEGKLKVLLQTNSHSEYKGYFWSQKAAESMFAQSTIFRSTADPGDPGAWGYIGPYWAGWQFGYEDRSDDLLAAWPEFFMLTGPMVKEGWNHLLLSWDISQQVSVVSESAWTNATGSPVAVQCTTGCKAWMALNGVVCKDGTIQHEPVSPRGDIPGAPEGLPNATWSRVDLGLGPNDIIPQNAFLRNEGGVPKDNIPRVYAADLGIWGQGYADQLDGAHYISFLGLGGGLGIVDPTTVPDPKEFISPKYTSPPTGFSLPAGKFEFGVPTTRAYIAHNAGHVMAELNVWVGKTVAITEDNSDKILKYFITDTNKPVKVADTEAQFGTPHVQLHFTSHWQNGYNTGTIGQVIIGGKPLIISKGQFQQQGTMNKYKPDPELGK